MSQASKMVDLLVEAGDLRKAVDLGIILLKKNTHDVDLILATAKAFLQIDGKEQDAIKFASLALLVDSKNAEAYRIQGRARLILEDYAAAEAAYDQALRLSPLYERAILEKAMLYRLQMRFSKELQMGQRLALVNPVSGFRTQADAYQNLALAISDTVQARQFLSLALDCWGRAIERDPTSADAYARKARVFAALNRLPEAMMVVENGLRIDRKNSYVLQTKRDLQRIQRTISRNFIFGEILKMLFPPEQWKL